MGRNICRYRAGVSPVRRLNKRRKNDALSYPMAAEAVVESIARQGGQAVTARADVADENDVLGMFAELDRLFGPLAGLVNSAGVDIDARPVTEMDASAVERLLKVNVLGVMLCCREAVRRMSRRLGGGGGAIVNVSSMAATIGGRAGAGAYAASKAAVDAFTIGLAKEVGADGVRVNSVRPGMTATDMNAALRADPARTADIAATIPLGRMASAAEVAEPIAWLLSERASFVSGACLDVSGGGFMIGAPLEPGKAGR